MTDIASELRSTAGEPNGREWDWLGCGAFGLTGTRGPEIPLVQTGRSEWRLADGVSIRYKKATGLEKYVRRGDLDASTHADLLTVTSTELEPLDLASVPGPIRWFARSYGDYTPAAIFHDHHITDQPEKRMVPPEYADRYFRYQLGAVGVRRFKRYIMWAAVALRTRLKSDSVGKRIAVCAWLVLAAAGIAAFVMSGLDWMFGTGMWFGDTQVVFFGALAAPLFLSLLWGRQYGAGLVAAAAALWVLPAAILAVVGYGVYLVLEEVTSLAFGPADIARGPQAIDARDRVDG